MSAILQAEDISVMLGGRRIVDGVRFDLAKGELAAIVGPNGAGKTTLVRALAGLLPAGGRVIVEGHDRLTALQRARRIAYLPQGHAFHWPMAVADVVALGRLPHGAGFSPADHAAVRSAMERMGVVGFAGRPVTSLSGGERARVALARALAVGAPILLADEPVAALDPRYRLLVMETLRESASEGGSVVVVLHDLALAARYADRIIVMNEGRVVAEGVPRDVLSDELLREVFGVETMRFARDGEEVLMPWRVAKSG
jgi:iron complex transport system ATP-binding protein